MSLLCERPCDTLMKASGGARETLPPPRPRFPDMLPAWIRTGEFPRKVRNEIFSA